MKKSKKVRKSHKNCGTNPCWECHRKFMRSTEPMIKAMTKLYSVGSKYA